MLQNDHIIKKIRKRLDIMTKSKYRTTNFSIIEYFSKNNFEPLNVDDIIFSLGVDYKSNPEKYVLANNNHFKSERTFISSIKNSIGKNKSFVKGPGIGQLSLNLKKTLEYLETMFHKYTNNSKDIKTPIKLPKSKYKEKNMDVIKLNGDNTDEDDSDIEFEIKNKKKKKINNYKPKKMNYDSRQIYRYNYLDNIKKEKINDINDSKYIPDYIKKEIIINEVNPNYERIPYIFSKNIINVNSIISLDKDAIFESSKYVDEYSDNLLIREESYKKIKILKKYLNQLYSNKCSYDILCETVKKWQKELCNIYKGMENELNAIKAEINSKSYCYEDYNILKNIIFDYSKNYDNIVEILCAKLNEIKSIEKMTVDVQIKLNNLLDSITLKKKVNDFIEDAIKINEEFIINQIDLRKMPEYNYQDDLNILINIDEIRNNFQEEKKSVMDSMNEIDDEIGNISIL